MNGIAEILAAMSWHTEYPLTSVWCIKHESLCCVNNQSDVHYAKYLCKCDQRQTYNSVIC